ncbi:MAG: tetratricopeptide repeat protein [Saprospiraceae bacterium]
MVTDESFNQLFQSLKNCSPHDVGKTCMAIMESFVDIDREARKVRTEEMYAWAEQNAAKKPLSFCYAKLILAFSFFYNEQYDKALPLLIELQRLFSEQNDPDGAAVGLNFLGSIYRTFGDVDLALKACWTAHEQLSKSGKYPFFFLACNINIGGIYVDRKHYDEAVPHFLSALDMAEKLEKYYWVIYALHGLSKVYLIQQKYPEARECLERAMIVAEKYNHPLSVCNSLTELGNYYFTTGSFAEAEDFHKRSLTLREQNQFIGGAITNCIRLGEIYSKQFKPKEAIAILEKGLKLATQMQVKPKMYQIHFLLSEIYQSKNDVVKSLFHYKLFHELREQVELEDNERKIKNAHLVFEAEQTMKENIIIKKQKAEIEKKNIELQETIDELTRARIGKKAKAITLVIAIILFVLEDTILHFALEFVSTNNYFISLIVKMVIIFSLSPINKAVEGYLLKRIIKKRKREVLV